MIKNKHKKILVAYIIFVFVIMYGVLPVPPAANAVDSIANASDTLSDSDIAKPADHDIWFTTGSTTPSGGVIDIVFPSAPQTFGTIVEFDCPDAVNWASSTPNAYTARCTAANDRAPGAKLIKIYDLQNATTSGTQYLYINNYKGAGATNLLERVKIGVVIISDVLMTARVDSILTFEIAGTSSGVTVNGETCDVNTTATTTPFGTLLLDTPTTACQQLRVTTNATNGYTVTVEQDNELTSSGGANINSFRNSPTNTGTTTPEAWASPAAVIDQYNTYGHMGLTADDSTLSWGGGDPFGAAQYVGFATSTPVEVLYHTGASDGSTQDVGFGHVAYTVEISSLQESGDYESTLTYICTPTF